VRHDATGAISAEDTPCGYAKKKKTPPPPPRQNEAGVTKYSVFKGKSVRVVILSFLLTCFAFISFMLYLLQQQPRDNYPTQQTDLRGLKGHYNGTQRMGEACSFVIYSIHGTSFFDHHKNHMRVTISGEWETCTRQR
jgi:hypothetical protein